MMRQIFLPLLSLTAAASIHAQTTVSFDNATDLEKFIDVRNADNNAYNSGTGADGANGFMELTNTNDNASYAFRTIYDADANGNKSVGDLFGEVTYGAAFDVQGGKGNFGMFWAPASGTNDAIGIYLETDWSGTGDRIRVGGPGIGVDANTWANNGTLGFTSGIDATYLSGDAVDTTTAQWLYMEMESTRTGITASDTRTLTTTLYDGSDNTGTVIGSVSFTYAAGQSVEDGYIGITKYSTYTADPLKDVIINVDNFTVVPEPSSYALLSGFLALTCVMIRRRA